MPKLRVIIKPPPEPQGDAEQQTEALRDYLLQMSEELAYVLTHLEADNINDSTFERIQGMIPRPYTGLPVMDGDASAGQSAQWARGDHRHKSDTSKVDKTTTVNGHDLSVDVTVTKGDVGLGNVANERQYSAQNPPPIPTPGEVGAIPVSEKGSAGGVAELDSNGMVPSAQLPSYVDDVLEYPTQADFPVAGENGKIYVALDSNRTYRWSGSAYVEISESLALGETSSTAYRGDRGKTAYDHSQTVGNPHGTTAADVGARPNDWMPSAADVGARPDTWMPTASDVGARPDTWTPSAADVGARPDDWFPDAEDVPYDPTQSGLMATDVQAAIDELAQGGGSGSSASAVSYDNTGSGLTATNVQDAIDEVVTDLNGKQDTLTIDATPAASSTNPVQSGGVYTDVRTRVPNYGKGKNLLRNWGFHVNQRGMRGGASSNSYTVDGWYRGTGNGTCTINNDDTITLDSSGGYVPLMQTIDADVIEALVGKRVTVSMLLQSGELLVSTVSPLANRENIGYVSASSYIGIDTRTVNHRFYFVADGGDSYTLKYIKLELGSEQTLAHQENGTWVLNEIPDYEEELIKGQTSTADPSDTYANKSLATEQQLAYVETGATVSNPNGYTAGEYFCWNGLLYRAKTAISNGDLITPNTNCFQVSRGGLNDISQNIIRGSVTFRNSEQVRDVFFNVTFLSPPTVVATFVGAKNDVRAQVANSAIYVQETTTTSCKLNIDRTATSGNVVVNYIAVGDIGLVRNAT